MSTGTLCVADCTLRAVTFQLRKGETGRTENTRAIYFLTRCSISAAQPSGEPLNGAAPREENRVRTVCCTLWESTKQAAPRPVSVCVCVCSSDYNQV